MNNMSNLSPAEILNYIKMPEQAATTIKQLMAKNESLEADKICLEKQLDLINDIYYDLKDILNHNDNQGNEMLEALIKISKRIYDII